MLQVSQTNRKLKINLCLSPLFFFYTFTYICMVDGCIVLWASTRTLPTNNTYMFGVAGGPTAKSGVLLFSVPRI